MADTERAATTLATPAHPAATTNAAAAAATASSSNGDGDHEMSAVDQSAAAGSATAPTVAGGAQPQRADVCPAFNTPAGCQNSGCQLLHQAGAVDADGAARDPATPAAPESTQGPLLVKSCKPCMWHRAGSCRRGEECWFTHDVTSGDGRGTEQPGAAQPGAASSSAGPSSGPAAQAAAASTGPGSGNVPANAANGPASATAQTTQEASADAETCSICIEVPAIYGLLEHCNHVFCQDCLRKWRKTQRRVETFRNSDVTQRCPICRAPSHFVVPSPISLRDEDKTNFIATFKQTRSKQPCKHFEKSKEQQNVLFCPFGDDCHYAHQITPDGPRHLFGRGATECLHQFRRRGRAGAAANQQGQQAAGQQGQQAAAQQGQQAAAQQGQQAVAQRAAGQPAAAQQAADGQRAAVQPAAGRQANAARAQGRQPPPQPVGEARAQRLAALVNARAGQQPPAQPRNARAQRVAAQPRNAAAQRAPAQPINAGAQRAAFDPYDERAYEIPPGLRGNAEVEGAQARLFAALDNLRTIRARTAALAAGLGLQTRPASLLNAGAQNRPAPALLDPRAVRPPVQTLNEVRAERRLAGPFYRAGPERAPAQRPAAQRPAAQREPAQRSAAQRAPSQRAPAQPPRPSDANPLANPSDGRVAGSLGGIRDSLQGFFGIFQGRAQSGADAAGNASGSGARPGTHNEGGAAGARPPGARRVAGEDSDSDEAVFYDYDEDVGDAEAPQSRRDGRAVRESDGQDGRTASGSNSRQSGAPSHRPPTAAAGPSRAVAAGSGLAQAALPSTGLQQSASSIRDQQARRGAQDSDDDILDGDDLLYSDDDMDSEDDFMADMLEAARMSLGLGPHDEVPIEYVAGLQNTERARQGQRAEPARSDRNRPAAASAAGDGGRPRGEGGPAPPRPAARSQPDADGDVEMGDS
ncbi:uncharacterized protein PSFLO_06302 [Pseudozyma flocculosa]|uniref:Uncharacterized protein n=1 Tax=Pseudozyma flocculosa TaxID=84751 RepID=A0A5C3F9D5_9BASI|nr:uncharacterized protein PSFLO_06302 [Pseudozyma flocculosa]